MSAPIQVPDDVKSAFDRLYEEWLRFLDSPELRHSSRPSDYTQHPAYEGIVQLGETALPFIVEKLREGQFFLNVAMARITGIDLRRQLPPAVSEQEVARCWVQWWEGHNVRPHNVHVPTTENLLQARERFHQIEPRSVFYRAATELIERAVRGQSNLSVAEALAVLLQTWNVSYYRFHGRFDEQHFSDIENLWKEHGGTILTFRRRSILSLCDEDEITVTSIFRAFEQVLGPVGAAKALHLLAPDFFPLWDRTIAQKGHRLSFQKRGENASRYWTFMQYVRWQCQQLLESDGESLKEALSESNGLLKLLDEFNYVTYTRQQT